jgi:hypothetical protein
MQLKSLYLETIVNRKNMAKKQGNLRIFTNTIFSSKYLEQVLTFRHYKSTKLDKNSSILMKNCEKTIF